MKFLLLLLVSFSSISYSANKQIVLVAGNDSHRYGDHEFRAGCHLLAKKLNESGLPLTTTVIEERNWPKSNEVFEKANAIIIYSDGFRKHPLKARKLYHYFDGLIKKGKGIGFMHYACEVEQAQGHWLTDWIGGYYERLYSVNPHWTCESILSKQHPCTNGVENFTITDEWYFNIRLNDKIESVLKGIPNKAARSGKSTYPRGPLKHIVNAEGNQETLLWTIEREDGGRGFGFTGGHYHKNWQNDQFRKLILNTISWTAGIKIPKSGVQSTTPTINEMKANMKPIKKGNK